MGHSGDDATKGVVYTAHPDRFLTLSLFSAIAFLWAGSWLAVAPIADLAEERFEVGPGAINLFATLYLWLYLPSSLLGVLTTDTYSSNVTISVSATVNAAVCFVRWLALSNLVTLSPHGQYAVNLVAQVLAAMCQAMCLNLAARLTMDWFPSHERDLATTVATMANVTGQMVFSLLPPLIVHTPAQLGRIMLVQWIPGVVVAALSWRFLAQRPPSPPSASAALQWAEAEAAVVSAKSHGPGGAGWLAIQTIMHDASMLLSNSNFLLLAAGFSVGSGTVWAVLILEGQLITPCGYSDRLAGAAGAALLGTGVMSAFAVGAIMETTKAYVELQRGVMGAALAATAGVLAASTPGHALRLVFAYCALGAALQPLLPLTLEHAAEMTFPVPADVSTSVLFTLANIFSGFLVLALTPLLAEPASKTCTSVFTPASGTVLTFMACGVLLTLLVKKDYRRSSCEHGGGGDGSGRQQESPESPLLGEVPAASAASYGAIADPAHKDGSGDGLT